MKLTQEQTAAIEAKGKVIVSASAGSGKTFVMIQKLVDAVAAGCDLTDVLAVTFTKKAAAQMKEKLRSAIISRLENAGEEKERLKLQLSEISSADISTIHSFCARLLRKYFYVLGINSDFDIISADDATAQELKKRALDEVFDRNYEEGSKEFAHLLKCFMKRRSDNSLRKLVLSAHTEIRSCARYADVLEKTPQLYCRDGFYGISEAYSRALQPKYERLIRAIEEFRAGFPVTKKVEVYNKIFDEMTAVLTFVSTASPFGEKPPLTYTRKPSDAEEDKPAGEEFKKFKDGILKRYNALYAGFADEQTEYERFMNSGAAAAGFSSIVLQFDETYSRIKSEENKLDYNDLEHLTLKLLEDGEVRKEINSGYKYVFVDEYQDVNPVQEEIISALTGETFLVGDVKQAIYGFRGSKSVFFSQKFKGFETSGGKALRLSSNFRSTDGVVGFVNSLFSRIMTGDSCGIDYVNTSVMKFGGLYPVGTGSAVIEVFGKDEEEERELKVYSVTEDGRKTAHTREGLAVLAIVEEELKKEHFDLKTGSYRPTTQGDICILTRKNRGESAEGIVRALVDAGYAVAGAQESNICNLPEVKQMLDVLSLIDNSEQDFPLIAALLSPLGGFCEDELAQIRIAADAKKPASLGGAKTGPRERKTFRRCCEEYAVLPGAISNKLNIFWRKLRELREASGILRAGELIDELLGKYGLESGYGVDGEQKVKNVLRLAGEGASLPLAAFLQKIKAGGYSVSAPAPAQSDSIKIMSMHASKGLEFPVVIIADICKTFKGGDCGEIPFDEEYGFAPKCYDVENMIAGKTVLRSLLKLRMDAEELKNELNLFYVACTRAMCRLHIMCEEVKPFDFLAAADARCYADLFDVSKFPCREREPFPLKTAGEVKSAFIASADENAVNLIESKFALPYAYGESVNLPVKSSASAILKMGVDEPRNRPKRLFGGEGETGTERGIAYHRYLELCDYSIKDKAGVGRELERFLQAGLITEEQYKILDAEEISSILNMPVFGGLEKFELFREREFLCRLPAKDILPATAEDGVLVQGAIDLLAVQKNGGKEIKIIDYKYSHKSDEELKSTYYKQLNLYKKAVSLIMKKREEEIEAVIVNIFLKSSFKIV